MERPDEVLQTDVKVLLESQVFRLRLYEIHMLTYSGWHLLGGRALLGPQSSASTCVRVWSVKLKLVELNLRI